MRESLTIAAIFVLSCLVLSLYVGAIDYLAPSKQISGVKGTVTLPEPALTGGMSVEEAIYRRRSIRKYSAEPLTLSELGQVLWSAQGITLPRRGFRAAPSAGATYPIIIYVSVREGGVEGLAPGIYLYDPFDHALHLLKEGDYSSELGKAALDQEWVKEAPVCLIIAANFERTTSVYGERGIRYVYMEAGHIGQNIYLEATALGLGTVAVGAFYDDKVKEIIGCREDPLYIFPLGKKP
ncbi:MAG: SagB/ThcOx family dehydrogenase [Candidatus Korarchaeota archaeon]|nr:SagB/ThcOx family dehydrogenase [Candidatus Korarchaeota archaeon]